MRSLSRRTAFWLALLAALLVPAVAAPLAAAAGPELRAAPLSAEFLRYQADVKQRHTLGLDRVPGFRPGLVPAPMDISYLKGARIAAPMLTYAASFDLRTSGKVSPVKDQDPYGTCWTFATLASLESCLMPGETADYSEDNMALASGFGAFADGAYDHGGNYWMSSAYLIRWGGPVTEAQDPYGDSLTPSGLSAAKHVQRIRYIPGGATATATDNIKYALTTYGAVATSISWQDSAYLVSTAGFYYSGSASTNHAVTIVGWDDTYSASNFVSAAPGNGAWLVKNSWGTGWGQSGYFWISYYDKYCGSASVTNAVFDGAQPTTNYSAQYSYDPLGDVDSIGYTGNTGWEANVFTAHADQSISAVGFYALAAGTTYTVYAGSALTSLQPLGSGSFTTPGFYTVPLSTPLAVSSGSQFTVAVRLTTPGYNYPLGVEYALPGYSDAATAAPGQSYTSASGSSWNDLTAWKSTASACLKAYATAGSGPPPGGDDDDIPGVAIPSSPIGGTVARTTDLDDVFSIALDAGETLSASITGAAGTDFDLYLYAPGTLTVKGTAPAAAAAKGLTYPDAFTHKATQSGIYYLDVYAASGEGSYTVTYSVSADTVGPVCTAKNIAVRRGRTCKLLFKVYDAQSTQVKMTVTITTRSGRVKMRRTSAWVENYNGYWSTKYTCRLAKGKYRIVVTGKDFAGNTQSRVGRATLTVY